MQIEKNCRCFVKDYLYNYKSTCNYIGYLEECLKELDKGNEIGVKAVSYEFYKVDGGNNQVSSVEIEALSRLRVKEELQIKLYGEKRIKNRVDKYIQTLDKQDKKLIELKFFKRKNMNQMQEDMFLSDRGIRKRINKIIDKLAINTFGTIKSTDSKIFIENMI